MAADEADFGTEMRGQKDDVDRVVRQLRAEGMKAATDARMP